MIKTSDDNAQPKTINLLENFSAEFVLDLTNSFEVKFKLNVSEPSISRNNVWRNNYKITNYRVFITSKLNGWVTQYIERRHTDKYFRTTKWSHQISRG